MWVTTATAMELEHPDDGHQTTIVRLGIQTEEYMKQELCKELGNFSDSGMVWNLKHVADLDGLFAVYVSRHKLPPIAITTVLIMDDEDKKSDTAVSGAYYGHGVLNWEKVLDAIIAEEVKDPETLETILGDFDTVEDYRTSLENRTYILVDELLVRDVEDHYPARPTE